MCVAESFPRGGGVPHVQAPLADLIEATRGHHADLVALKLFACLPRFLLGLRPGTAERDDLGAVHPADAGETRDRLPLAPARRGFGPFTRPSVVGKLETRGDRAAVDPPGRPDIQLACGRSERCDVELRKSLLVVTVLDECEAYN